MESTDQGIANDMVTTVYGSVGSRKKLSVGLSNHHEVLPKPMQNNIECHL